MKKWIGVIGISLTLITAAQAGNFDLKGVFMVVDESGTPLGNVNVSYKIENGNWKSCGSSQSKTMELGSGYIKKGTKVNFVQYQPCFPEGKRLVIWRFVKSGYKENTVSTRMQSYNKGTGKDIEFFRKVTMVKIRKSSSSSSNRSSNRSGFYCMDCDSKLIDAGKCQYYCPSCRLGKCDRCGGTYRQPYMVANGSRLMKEENSIYCKGCAR